MLSKRSIPDYAWVLGIALAVRLCVLFLFSKSVYFLPTAEDMKFYSDWAQRIAAGDLTDHRAFYGLPGYPYLLGGIYALFGHDSFAVGVVGFLQTLSEAGIALLIFQIGKWAFPEPHARIVGGLAALGWIFFQPAQTFSVILMPTTWAVLTFWGVFCWSVHSESRSRWRPWLGMGLLTGLVATMVATVLFILPISLAVAVRNLRKPAAVLTAAACLFGGVFFGASPCWIHNYFIAGEPVLLSAHSGLNFWVGNNPTANGYPKLPPGLRGTQEGMLKDSIRIPEQEAGHPLKRVEVSRYWSAKADAYIHEHPQEWLGLMVTKIKNVWNAAQYDDLSIITALDEEGVLTPGLRFGLVAVLALAGVALAWRRAPRAVWIMAAVALHMAALLPVFVTERYRLAAVPGLLLLAAFGLVELWDALASRRWGRASVWLGAGTAALVLVTLPPHEESLWWLDTYNTGLKLLVNGDIKRALPKLERAYAYAPGNADVNSTLGNFWFRAHKYQHARYFYQQALKLNAQNLSALNNLALLDIGQAHWPQARQLLAAALKLEPEDANLYYLMAYCDEKLGDAAAAKTGVKKALSINPEKPEFQALRKKLFAAPALNPTPPSP